MENLVKQGALGSVLVASHMITEDDIQAALDEQEKTGCRFGEALVKLGIVTQEDIDWALSSQLNIPYIHLRPDLIDPKVIGMVPSYIARKYNLVPIYSDGDELTIAIADPLNRVAISLVEELTGCRVTVSIPILVELREMLDLFYGPSEHEITLGFSSFVFPAKMLESINKDITGGRFLELILGYAVKNRFSSISLQPLSGDTVSVVGKQGKVTKEVGKLAVEYYPDLLMHIRKMARMKACSDISAKGTIEQLYEGEKVYFQVLTLKGEGGDYVTLKASTPVSFPSSLLDFDLSQKQRLDYLQLASSGDGIILFAASTPEGYLSMIDLFLKECDTTEKTVIILGEGQGGGQRTGRFPSIPLQNGTRNNIDTVINAVLEHDPDILVFEPQMDFNSFTHAVRTANRGKLVLCGMSCRDKAELLERLFDLHLQGATLSPIKGIVMVTAKASPCPHCTEGPPGEGDAAAGHPYGHGCSLCGYTGIARMKHMLEIIPFTSEITELVESADAARELLQQMESKGYLTA